MCECVSECECECVGVGVSVGVGGTCKGYNHCKLVLTNGYVALSNCAVAAMA